MDQGLDNGRFCLTKLKIPKPEPQDHKQEEEDQQLMAEEEDEAMEEEEEDEPMEEEEDEHVEEEEEEDDDGEEEDEDDDEEEEEEEEAVVVVLPYKCQVCDKRFKSGKALGGHKRIHNQQAVTAPMKKTTNNKFIKTTMKMKMKKKAADSTICPSCLKTFPSSKSLYGHMRSHPERPWRGIEPPAVPPPNKSPVTLPLTWAVTAKRGRKGIITTDNTSPAPASAVTHATNDHDHDDHDSVEDRRNYDAVRELMMLSLGIPTTNQPPPPPSQDDHHFKNVVMMIKKRKLPQQDDADSDSSSDSNLLIKKSRTSRRRKVKLVDDLDLDLRLNSEKPKPKPKLIPLAKPSSKTYACDVCKRSFSSFQALGGHKSIHNKTSTAPASAPAPAPAPTPRRLLTIDLNLPPSDEDQ